MRKVKASPARLANRSARIHIVTPPARAGLPRTPKAFASPLSGLAHGYGVRLPTEAEWEYACRAGSQGKFWWGEAKEDGKDRLNWSGPADGFQFTSPVDGFGSRGRNDFGLADMLGNVYEWCLDEYDAMQAHEDFWTGNPGARVLRGGTFYITPANCRCAHRYSRNPALSYSYYGFRVAVGSAR